MFNVDSVEAFKFPSSRSLKKVSKFCKREKWEGG
jgi:hypothetical protein